MDATLARFVRAPPFGGHGLHLLPLLSIETLRELLHALCRPLIALLVGEPVPHQGAHGIGRHAIAALVRFAQPEQALGVTAARGLGVPTVGLRMIPSDPVAPGVQIADSWRRH